MVIVKIIVKMIVEMLAKRIMLKIIKIIKNKIFLLSALSSPVNTFPSTFFIYPIFPFQLNPSV